MSPLTDNRPTLVVVTGPTGSGKTALAIDIARELGCEIISADSRQMFRGMEIGTAAPTPAELAAVPHHFVGTLNPDQYYSAAEFEADVLKLLPTLWQKNNYVVMCGGAMMYIDAVLRGIDQLPTISAAVRSRVLADYETNGLEAMVAMLQSLDLEGAKDVAKDNPRRVLHAIEICLEAGVPASTLRTGKVVERPWRTIMLAIDHCREQLFDRINRRVDIMIEQGLEQEARTLEHLRNLNSLNTVGYKEMFAMFDGTLTRETAIARIAKNTRVYAKKQLLWLRKHSEAILLDPLSDTTLLQQALNAITQRP